MVTHNGIEETMAKLVIYLSLIYIYEYSVYLICAIVLTAKYLSYTNLIVTYALISYNVNLMQYGRIITATKCYLITGGTFVADLTT